jgi:hypothetical protein
VAEELPFLCKPQFGFPIRTPELKFISGSANPKRNFSQRRNRETRRLALLSSRARVRHESAGDRMDNSDLVSHTKDVGR